VILLLALTVRYQASFTDTNFHAFFSMMVEVLVRPWEKMVLGMRFTELGAIRFDRDVRSVSNYLSSQTDFGGSREKFTRLQQMATILNLDPVSVTRSLKEAPYLQSYCYDRMRTQKSSMVLLVLLGD
jgi:hypothetical protein